ncbi:MAG TPA: LAGLIDADG family homing endonuclease [Alphaproteobacteria bacterium]|nr:LAGLIDADG family homing endonuclease [Alphaproteobacteria bacterium]
MYDVNEDVAEEIGMHVGDGSMNIYKVPSYTLACPNIDDKEFMIDYVIPLYEKIYGINIKPKLWSKGTYGFRIHSKKLIDFKISLGLPLGKKTNIKIPEIILRNDLFMKAFLRGFMATDGSINTFIANKRKIYPRLELTNVSQELMMQINVSLKNFGFRTSTWTTSFNYPKWNKSTRISLNGYEQIIKWDKEIGFINAKHSDKLRLLLYKK